LKGFNPREQGCGGDGDSDAPRVCAGIEPTADSRASSCRFGGRGGINADEEGTSEFIGGGETCGVTIATDGVEAGAVSSLSTRQLFRRSGLFVSTVFPAASRH